MDDNGKNASFQVDQEILDARGINMTVAEVAGLSTCKYSERVQAMRLNEDDHTFLKGLRRRIKNRLASQNSRRRSMEHLRRLSRELRAVRACKGDAVAERNALTARRRELADSARKLRAHVVQILKERSDPTPVPDIDIPRPRTRRPRVESHSPSPERSKNTFRLERDSVHYLIVDETSESQEKAIKTEIEDLPKKINAKTVFLNSQFSANGVKDSFNGIKDSFNGIKDSFNGIKDSFNGIKDSFNGVKDFIDCYEARGLNVKEECNGLIEGYTEMGGVLNLSIKGREGRKGHGRKQSAPRRIAYAFCDYEDTVLDLKIKKETH